MKFKKLVLGGILVKESWECTVDETTMPRVNKISSLYNSLYSTFDYPKQAKLQLRRKKYDLQFNDG